MEVEKILKELDSGLWLKEAPFGPLPTNLAGRMPGASRVQLDGGAPQSLEDYEEEIV